MKKFLVLSLCNRLPHLVSKWPGGSPLPAESAKTFPPWEWTQEIHLMWDLAPGFISYILASHSTAAVSLSKCFAISSTSGKTG